MYRVLLVDDVEDLLYIAKEFLTKRDPELEVMIVDSAEEALNKLGEEEFHVVVSDYKMPGIDGLELLEQLRNSNNNIPFIVFTEKGREEVAIRALNLGADYFVGKEGDPESQYADLAHVIRKVISHKKAEQKLSQAELVLQESEEKFRVFADQSPLGIAILQEQGIIYANNSIAEISGYTREEITSMDFDEFAEIIHPEDREFVFSQLRKKLAGEADVVPHYDFRIHKKSGEMRWFTNHSKNIKLESGPALAATLIDITGLKQAEEARCESEEKLRGILDSSPDGIIVTSLNGIITDCNLAAVRLSGFSTKEDLIGLNGFDLISPRDQQRAIKHMQDGLNYDIMRDLEYTIITKSGREIPVDVSSSTVRNAVGDPTSFVSVIKDITKRKRAEEELLIKDSAINSSNTAIAILDLNGTFTFVNKGFLELFDLENEELVLGKSISNLALEKELLTLLLQGIRKSGSWEDERTVKKRDGSPIEVRISANMVTDKAGKPIRILILVVDITELKRAEQELKKAKAFTESILANVPEVIYSLNSEMQPIFVSGRIEDLFGYTKEDFLNDPELWTKTIHPDDEPRLMKIIDDILKGEPYSVEFQFIIKDGTTRWVRASGVPSLNSKGEFVRLDGNVFDITNQKRTEEELRKQKEELSEFVHAMSHDLGNSLTAIRGYSELLKEQYNKSFVNKIHQQALGMNDLLNRSLELADAGLVVQTTDEVDLNHLVNKIAEQVIPENIEFSFESLPVLVCDREKVAQIFKNLFENAVIHGNSSKIIISRHYVKKGVNILVSNDGELILENNRSKLFQKGFSTKKGGLGLGLTIVKKIIEAHGWQISLDSVPETTFRISIPKIIRKSNTP